MEHFNVDFSKICKRVTPMHAVNNGPVYKPQADQRITNIHFFQEAGIPYVRNHDAAFYSTYGGEHSVDVHAIFPNFDADPYDPASYDFACTDEYNRVILLGGSEVFYRLGSKIEHGVKKYGTLPPPDFHKWAVICEHIIRHYNEGWADGFHYNIRYWEIWNEPDLDPDDSTNKRTWGGTKKEFFRLYNITFAHLKRCFPHLKIGGPAAAGGPREWCRDFFAALEAKPDFFSWHVYAHDPNKVVDDIRRVRAMMDEYGLQGVESILNEWNYVKGWENDPFIESIKTIQGLKGASFTAATMCASLYEPLDMLMYYDARPCAFNGMFAPYIAAIALKGYYPFLMFNALYKLGKATEIGGASDTVKLAAATDGEGKCAVMLTYFDDDAAAAAKDIILTLEGLPAGKTAKLFLLDEAHDMEEVKTLPAGDAIDLHMTLYSTYLITIA